MRLKIKIIEECGYDQALIGLSFNKNQDPKNMPNVAKKLAKKDGGHNKFLESICVWIEIDAPRYFWAEFDTYRVGMTKQSQSTMHTITKQPLTQNNFEEELPAEFLVELNKLILKKDLVKLKSYLPEGFMQKRMICTNYKTLRNIIQQRRSHKLPHWRAFCVEILLQVKNPELL